LTSARTSLFDALASTPFRTQFFPTRPGVNMNRILAISALVVSFGLAIYGVRASGHAERPTVKWPIQYSTARGL
jgi:hypothetical protein